MDACKVKAALAVTAVAVVLALLAADCAWLHAKGARQEDALRDLSARLAAAEKRQGEMEDRQKEVAALAHGLEKWVQTSSVEGRFKAYSRQAGEEYRALTNKLRDLKKAAAEGLKSIQDELNK